LLCRSRLPAKGDQVIVGRGRHDVNEPKLAVVPQIDATADRRPAVLVPSHDRSLNQVTKGLAKTIRAMADETLDSQIGARICNGLGIMRACLETQKLEQLEARMDEIADRVARNRTNAARERTSTHETQRPSH
jgi:hypothetical protein